MAVVIYSNAEINQIGLSILGDYAYMLVKAIKSDDPARIQQAQNFAVRFDALYDRAGQELTQEESTHLNKDSFALSREFRTYVLDILKVVLTIGYEVYFKPTVLSHIINFADYYMIMLNTFLLGRKPTFDPIVQDIFWLPVFATQCRYIADNVGYYSRTQRKRALEFAEILNEKYIFAIELQGLTQIGTDDFPIAKAHRREVDAILKEYAQFLVGILLEERRNEIPGTLSLLYLDSAYRQLCTYSTELAVFSGNNKPACDPFASRYSLL